MEITQQANISLLSLTIC